MADEIWNTLLKFHREVFVPDFQRIFGDSVAPIGSRGTSLESNLISFRSEMRSHFEEMHKRFDRLESQARELKAALTRVAEKRARRRR